ncbi:MAG: hypothetical protein JO356_11525 [Acidobacteria bacterium]|nr:hypothetical protein [Acidobacteriota bacterium]
MPPRLRQLLGIAILAFLLVPCVSACAENGSPQICEARDLDISIVSESQSATDNSGHLLVIDFRNRGSRECRLAEMELRVPGTGDNYAWEAPPPDGSPAALTLRQRANMLPPGGLAHMLVAWSSVPLEYHGRTIANCVIRESLVVLPNNPGNQRPWLEVRNPGIRSCDTMFHSGLRAGPYQFGEPIAQQWLDRQKLQADDFSGEFLPDAQAERVSLRALSKVEYMPGTFQSGYTGYFELLLNVSSPASAQCPYRMLRKREEDGETTIYIDLCPPSARKTRMGSTEVELRPRDLGMLPSRPGRIEYEITSEVLDMSKIENARATYELWVRDPAEAMLPVIDSNLQGCRAEQLKFSEPIPLGRNWDHPKVYAPLGETLDDAKVYEAANISSDPCLLGGVPELKFLEPPEITTGFLLPPVCRNCATPVFKPRNMEWIELEPGSSAHFMVGRRVLDPTLGNLCTVIGGLELILPGDTARVKLPFDAANCGQVPVSAWREGPYDNDAMNVRYDRKLQRRERQRLTAAPRVPVECTKEISEDTGRPTMFPSQGITWGVSTRPVRSTEPALALLWLLNSSDQPASVMTCMSIDYFWARGVNIFDRGGHRVLSRREQKMKRSPESPDFWMCTRNFAISIPAHACMHGTFSSPAYDFSRDLRMYYELPPGRYFLLPAGKAKNNAPLTRVSEQSSGVEIVIEEP